MKLYKEALRRFQEIQKKSLSTKLLEPTAMTLATADAKGHPSARVVLLKDVDERGFVFYTNFNSQKGKELKENPWAALCFFWDPMADQVRVEGHVEEVSKIEADTYWQTRPRDSQLGAWASDQSSALKSRTELVIRVARFAKKYFGQPIPRPSYWSGFRLVPHKIEFWKRKPFRLHERTVYSKKEELWTKVLLFP